MEVHILYDESGTILAAVRLDQYASDNATSSDGSVPPPRPVPQPGQYTANIKVPDDFAHLSFWEVCNQLMVERREGHAMLKSRESGSTSLLPK